MADYWAVKAREQAKLEREKLKEQWRREREVLRAEEKLRLDARLVHVRAGNLGVHRTVGEGVTELILDFGPGYRIYFGQVGSTLIVLLCGGDKSTQHKDIMTAHEYWVDYRRRDAQDTTQLSRRLT